jgi:hypothetical protein
MRNRGALTAVWPAAYKVTRVAHLDRVRLLLAAAMLAVLVSAGLALVLTARRIPATYELGYGEGLVLWQAAHVTSPQVLYHPVSHYPFVVSSYPPVFPAVARVVGHLVGDPQMGARLAAAGAFLGILACIGALVAAGLSRIAARRARWAGVLVAAGLTASLPCLRDFVPSARVDGLGLLFSLTGVWLFVSHPATSWRRYAAMACFVAAVYTKQTFIAAPLACLLVWGLTDMRSTGRLVLVGAVIAAVPLALLERATGGQFALHVFRYTQHEYAARRLVTLYSQNVLGLWAPTLLAAPVVWRVVRRWRLAARRSSTRKPLVRTRPPETVLTYLSAYLVLAMAVALTVGNVGSGPYYFMEWNAVCCALAGIGFGWLVAYAHRSPTWERRALLACALVAVFGAAMMPGIANDALRLTPGARALDVARQDETDRTLAAVRQAPGPVLADDLTILVKAGKQIPFEPFSMFELARQGVWDETPLLEQVSQHFYSLVVTESDVNATADRADTRSARERLRVAVAKHYVLVDRFGKYRLYAPSGEPSTARPHE